MCLLWEGSFVTNWSINTILIVLNFHFINLNRGLVYKVLNFWVKHVWIWVADFFISVCQSCFPVKLHIGIALIKRFWWNLAVAVDLFYFNCSLQRYCGEQLGLNGDHVNNRVDWGLDFLIRCQCQGGSRSVAMCVWLPGEQRALLDSAGFVKF